LIKISALILKIQNNNFFIQDQSILLANTEKTPLKSDVYVGGFYGLIELNFSTSKLFETNAVLI